MCRINESLCQITGCPNKLISYNKSCAGRYMVLKQLFLKCWKLRNDKKTNRKSNLFSREM